MSTQRRSPMRLIVTLLLLITGSAIANVAVAWGCTIWGDGRPLDSVSIPAPGSRSTSGSDLEWLARHHRRLLPTHPLYGGYFFEKGELHGLGLNRSAYFALPDQRNKGGGGSGQLSWMAPIAHRMLAGLPCPALECNSFDNWKLVAPARVDYGVGPIDTEVRRLPIRPLWPNFAINTIFYAAILALLFFAPGFIRRRLRIHRGNCPACGYHIASGGGTSATCSECGSLLPAALRYNSTDP